MLEMKSIFLRNQALFLLILGFVSLIKVGEARHILANSTAFQFEKLLEEDTGSKEEPVVVVLRGAEAEGTAAAILGSLTLLSLSIFLLPILCCVMCCVSCCSALYEIRYPLYN